MAANRPRYSKEEFARRGDVIYERDIRPFVEAGNKGKFIAIDIETGAYEIDDDELAASDRLLARVPPAAVHASAVSSSHSFSPSSPLSERRITIWSSSIVTSTGRWPAQCSA